MKQPRILNALAFLDDDLIEQADSPVSQSLKVSPSHWKLPLAAAACAVIAAGAIFFTAQMLPDMVEGEKVSGMDGAEPQNAKNHPMHYDGPVFPLMIQNGASLTAERTITLDFTDAETKIDYEGKLPIRDLYKITNKTDRDASVQAFYPICGNYQMENWPSIQVDGKEIPWQLFGGDFAGSFIGIPDTDLTSINLKAFDTFEQYLNFVQDGHDLKKALESTPKLEQPVIVYEVSNIETTLPELHAETLALHFKMDPDKTKVLTYLFNGSSEDSKTGEQTRSFFVREQREKPEYSTRYLIVQGEDIQDLRLAVYKDGACEADEEISNITAEVTRSETTLGEVLHQIAQQSNPYDCADSAAFERYYKAICEQTAEHSVLGEHPKERYDDGRLDELVNEVNLLNRVLYLAFDLTVPAGQSVQIEISQNKSAGYYFENGVGDEENRNIYDFSTVSDGSLLFTKQTAVLKAPAALTITEQNFGFDPKSGIYEANLNLDEPHYYLSVK